MTKTDLRFVQDIMNIMNNGIMDENPRPRYPDGAPAYTKFVNHVVRGYNLAKEFPICTLRPIAWRTAIKEILWIFQDASNDINLLKDKYNVHYWDEWNVGDNTIGSRYGHTVNRYNLMSNLIDEIKTDPYGRRHIIDLYQYEEFEESDGLYPCAFCSIWNVRGEYLDMIMIQRSGDMLTASGAGGINEVQYAALQMMVAKATGYKPGIFTHVVANEQIYDRHFDAAKVLVKRADDQKLDMDKRYQYLFKDHPLMKFEPESDNFYDFKIDDFCLEGYNPIKPQLQLELGI